MLSTQGSEATRDLAEVPGYPISISLPGCLCVLGEILGDTILPHRMDHSTGKQKTQVQVPALPLYLGACGGFKICSINFLIPLLSKDGT